MKGLKETLALPWTRQTEALCLFMIFMSFVATKLVRLFTMKSTKGLKVTLMRPWVRKIEG